MNKYESTILKMTFDIVPVCVLVLDDDTLVRYINKSALTLINKGYEEVLGRKIGDSIGCISSTENKEGCGYGSMCAGCELKKSVSAALEAGQASEYLELNKQLQVDGKRNDIGSSAEAYANAYIGGNEAGKINSGIEADAVTVNPFFGYDGIAPFINACKLNNSGIFILVKTSNPSSSQIQDLITNDGKQIYEVIAGMVNELGKSLIGCTGYSSVGAVVGATHPEQAKVLRKLMPHAYFLVPGYGAQGGTALGAAAAFNNDGLGAIVNASRSVIFAYKAKEYADKYTEEQYQEAARAETIRMRDDINKAVGCFL